MQLKRLYCKNFMLFDELDLEFDKYTNLWFITGENLDDKTAIGNAVGKSTIYEIISWLFFNETIRGLKSPKDLINKYKEKINKEIQIIGEFIINNDVYKFEKTVTFFGKHIYYYKITKNDEIVAKTEFEYDKFIKDKLGLTYKLFVNAIVFTNTISSFIDLSPQQKIKKIAMLIELEKFDKLTEILKENYNNLLNEIDKLNYKKQTIEEMLKIKDVHYLEQQEKEWETKRKENLKIIQILIEQYKNEIQKIKQEIDILKNKTIDKEKINILIEELNDVNHKLNTLSDKKEKYNVLLQKIEKELTILDLQEQQTNKDLEKLKISKKYKTCPFCKQQINNKLIYQYESKYLTKLNEIKGLKTKNKKLKDEQIKKIYDIENQLQFFNAKKLEIEKQIKEVEMAEYKIKISINSLEQKIKEYQTLIQKKQEEYTLVKNEPNPYSLQKIKEIETYNQYQQELILIKEKLKKAQIKTLLFKFWIKKIPYLKTKLLEEVIYIFMNRANLYLNEISGGTLELDFVYSKTGKLKIEIRNRNIKTLLNNLSGSEKQKIKVAFNWAFADLVNVRFTNPINFVFYDEIFEGTIDELGLQFIINKIKEQSKEKQVFIISHDINLQNYLFNNVVKIIREHNVSKAEIITQ